jgi:hypothetical protein
MCTMAMSMAKRRMVMLDYWLISRSDYGIRMHKYGCFSGIFEFGMNLRA